MRYLIILNQFHSHLYGRESKLTSSKIQNSISKLLFSNSFEQHLMKPILQTVLLSTSVIGWLELGIAYVYLLMLLQSVALNDDKIVEKYCGSLFRLHFIVSGNISKHRENWYAFYIVHCISYLNEQLSIDANFYPFAMLLCD